MPFKLFVYLCLYFCCYCECECVVLRPNQNTKMFLFCCRPNANGSNKSGCRMKCVLSEVARIIAYSFMDFCVDSSQNRPENGRTFSYLYAIVIWDCGGRCDFRVTGSFWVNIFHFTNSAQWVKFMSVCMWKMSVFIVLQLRSHCPVRSAGWKARIHSLAQLCYLSSRNGFRFVRQLLLCVCMCCWNCCPRWLFSLYCVLSSVFPFTMMMAPPNSHQARNAP